MSERQKKLIATERRVKDESGKYLFTISMTDLHKELINNEYWDKENESWLAYRERIKEQLREEENKQNDLALDIVAAYNEKYNLR